MKLVYFGLSFCFIFLISHDVTAQYLPLKPARTISFTTSEGTNMDVNSSPDGKIIIFSLLGDLYTMPVSGGTAAQLTRGVALHRDPVYSHDGNKVAYMGDGSGNMCIRILDLKTGSDQTLEQTGKALRNLGNLYYPIWSPDDHAVAIGNSVYRLDGGKTTLPYYGKILRFSEDGRFVYFLWGGKLCKYGMAKQDTTMVSLMAKRINDAVLSPNAHWLVYLKSEGDSSKLMIKDVASGGERLLIPAFYLQTLNRWSSFSFSPDSKHIYISYGGKIHCIDTETGNDRIIPFLARVNSDLGSFIYNTFRVNHEPFKVKYTRWATASPDGKRLVFTALDKLYMMTLPKGKPHCLVGQNANQFQPTWSPDGKWIAYVSWCDTVGGFLWKVPANGGKPVQLTTKAGEYTSPSWSPNGRFIAVIKGCSADFPEVKRLSATGNDLPKLDGDDFGRSIGQLQLINSVGGSVKAVTDSVPLWNQLSFSANSRVITYESSLTPTSVDKSVTPLLVSIDLDTKEKKIKAYGNQLNKAPLNFYLERSLSPDGHYVIYSRGEDLFLQPVVKLPVLMTDTSKNPNIIRFSQGLDPHWEKGGKLLTWSYGNQFYRITPDKILGAAKNGMVQKIFGFGGHDNNITTIDIKPDQTINLDITVPSLYGRGTIALKNVRIITMQGSKIIEHGTIIIQNGRFMKVGKNQQTIIPEKAKVYDLAGKTVIPGFVDLHLHMHGPGNFFPQQAWQYLVNLAYGVTTARDPSTFYEAFGGSELLATGQMTGPRLYPSGRSIGELQGANIRIDNLDDARRTVQKRKELGGTFMKQYQLPTRIQRQWLAIAAYKQGLNVTNEGEPEVINDIAQLKNGSTGIEHNPYLGDIYDDIITLWARSGTWLTPTLQVAPGPGALVYFDQKYWQNPDPKLSRFMPDEPLKKISSGGLNNHDSYSTTFLHASEIDARLRHAGGRVTLGSHGDDEGIGVHNELWALQAGGLTNMEALQAATIMGAEAIGIQKDIGSIEPGKIADLIILNSNPLDDIHNSRDIKYVMKDGILYDGDTLDELWPVYKKCPEWRLKDKSVTK